MSVKKKKKKPVTENSLKTLYVIRHLSGEIQCDFHNCNLTLDPYNYWCNLVLFSWCFGDIGSMWSFHTLNFYTISKRTSNIFFFLLYIKSFEITFLMYDELHKKNSSIKSITCHAYESANQIYVSAIQNFKQWTFSQAKKL